MHVTIDSAGRIVIPKSVRDALHIMPGDELTIDNDDVGLTLKPVRKEPTIIIKHGFPVLKTHEPFTSEQIVDLIAQMREERMDELLNPE